MSGKASGHLMIEQWRRYIHDEMTLTEREKADQELAVCEDCMQLLMMALEESAHAGEPSLPEMEMPDMARIEDRVIAELLATAPAQAKDSLRVPIETAPVRRPKRRGSWLQHPAAHYTIAASITLLLMATGALTGFSEKLQQLEETEPEAHTIGAEWTPSEPSWSDQLVDKAGGFFDDVQAWRFK